MNLLKADFYHLLKEKVFYVLLGIICVFPFVTCLLSSDMTSEQAVLHSLDTTFICAIVGIMIALFVGKDYANNTIRNKICYGENRHKIMAATFIESAIICLVFVTVSVLSSLVFGGIFGKFAFSPDFAAKLFCQILILLAFSIIVAAITISTKSMKIGLVVTLLMSLILSSVAQMLPMLAVTNGTAAFFCRIIYATVSSNLLNGTGGTYICKSFSRTSSASITFNHLYLNSIAIAAIYALIAIAVTTIVVKRQNYK